jgi:HK97 gp10 family phage protein
MSDFENMMNGYLENVGGLVNLTVEERSEATQKGAEVLKENMSDLTRSLHYNKKRKIGKMPHLADSITTGQLDGTKEDGDTAVGFTTKDHNHARIARFLNDGTVKMRGDHFVDKGFVEYEGKAFQTIGDALTAIQERKAK